jgi:6-bladed beta-propeller
MKISNSVMFIFIFFVLTVCSESFTQTNSDSGLSHRVNFVKSLTSIKDIENQNIFDKLASFILGDTDVKLQKPISVIVNDTNKLIILDQGLLSLITFDLKENIVDEIDSKFEFPSLISISQFKDQQCLFTDSKNNKVYTYNYQLETIESLNDSIDLNRPTGIGYVKSKKEIWVAETGNHSIVILDSLGQLINRIGKRGSDKGEFNFPTSIWVDNNEQIYIIDAINFRIQIFDNSGSFIKMFGEQGDATGYLARPKGIATDSYGNIYIVDALFHNVQIFNSAGVYLSNIGTQGKENGEFWLPNGIFIDKYDRIYIADSYNSRIQIFQLN